MLNFRFEIKNSNIKNAGKGLFTLEKIQKSKILIFPNQKHIIHSKESLSSYPNDSIEQISSIRWFEDKYTVDPDWSEESHLNHSFNPNSLWHLGFVFAIKDLEVGDELTIDYRNLLDEDTVLDFIDSETGREIRGFTWQQKMLRTSEVLLTLFKN